MGGNALKNTYTRRYSKQEFEDLQKEIISKLEGLKNTRPLITGSEQERYVNLHTPWAFIASYNLKETFGDLDILMNKAYYDIKDPNFKVDVYNAFHYNEIYYNTDVWSLDYKEFQIDLIFTEMKNFETSINYYAYNDLGNIMGRIANKFGLRYGHDGLKYKLNSVYIKRKYIGEFMVSKDIPKIFKFLKYDYDRFVKGFDTINDIFDYAMSTPYFAKEVFYYENLDHQNRTRNRKRATYAAFLDYIKDKEVKPYPFTKDKEIFFNSIVEFFPEANLPELRKQAEEAEKRKALINEKFNGHIVMELIPGITGKEIGKFISKFQSQFATQESFEEEILKASPEKIKNDILYLSKQ